MHTTKKVVSDGEMGIRFFIAVWDIIVIHTKSETQAFSGCCWRGDCSTPHMIFGAVDHARTEIMIPVWHLIPHSEGLSRYRDFCRGLAVSH